MDRDRQAEREQAPERPRAPATPAALPQIQLASAIGNYAFTAMIARDGPDAAPAAAAPTRPLVWDAPLDLGSATTKGEAAFRCVFIAQEAERMMRHGFEDEFAPLHDEALDIARMWTQVQEEPLTAADLDRLDGFTEDFRTEHRRALAQMTASLIDQFRTWRNPPLDEDALFQLRELVHQKFLEGDESALEELTEFKENCEELASTVEDWVGYGANAAALLGRAERLEQIQEAIEGIRGRYDEINDMVNLARNIGTLAGVLGDGPAGPDAIGQVEAGLELIDAVVGHFEVPGITQLWNGYIFEASRAALRGVRHVMDALYANERAADMPFLYFSDANLRRPTAPRIRQVGGTSYANLERNFPGGQPVIDYMWRVMLGESPPVPDDVEDYFIENLDSFNAGMGATNQIETDSAIGNLWNAFSRTESPNLRVWIRDNKEEVWTRLYGGMPRPRG